MRATYTSGAVLAVAVAASGAMSRAPAEVVTIEGTTHVLELVAVPEGRVDGHVVPAFSIGRREVSWELFDVFIYGLDDAGAKAADAVTRPSKPYISMDRGFGHRGYPAISMSHRGAEAFCRWLSVKTGDRYRLPTELEWQRACELGGVAADTLDAHAWHKGNARYTTHPVGEKAPDAIGLHDMHGNAAEWCIGTDGEPVTVGGSYRDEADALGCAARVRPTDDWNASDPQLPKSVWWLADGGFVGFRVVREMDGGEEHDDER